MRNSLDCCTRNLNAQTPFIHQGSPININSRFKVTGGEVKYQGSIVIESQNMKTSGSTGTMSLNVNWVNEYEAVRQELKEKCPWLADEELKSRFK